ncbi:MAG: hypothetical protein IJJ04_02100 [Clostridia bacterium]|nr:hypothetical protein [Clostridia bacterium]
MVQLLLDKGADPNIKNVLGNPPLFYIPLTYDRRRDRELVELMLQHGATWCPSFYRK